MRKISKSKVSIPERPTPAIDRLDTRPRQTAGATISGWSGSLEIDLDALFARRPGGASIGGGAALSAPAAPAPDASCVPVGTVSLSDGTRITFATVSQFEIVDTA